MLTNKYNTPEIMMDVLKPQPYMPAGGSDYSATSLVKTPRQLQLEKRYKDRIVRDARSCWALLVGNAFHEFIERQLNKMPEKYIVERKFTEFLKDRKVVAKIDAYDYINNILYDHKSGTKWDWNSDAKEEYINQMNVNAWFMRQDGFEPYRAYLNMLTKDWSLGMSRYEGEDRYPVNPMWLKEIPIWSEEEQEDYINTRLDLHIEHEETPDDELPYCTKAEMWAKDSEFAVKAPGVYRAKKRAATKKEAEDWLTNCRYAKDDWYIEERPGVRTRCEDWCDANRFCNQYQEYLKSKRN